MTAARDALNATIRDILRAAVIVWVACGAAYLLQPPMSANSMALAWLVIVALNPTEPFQPGCQLSFLATAALYWAAGRLLLGPETFLLKMLGIYRHTPHDPLDTLVLRSRPYWQQKLLWLLRLVGVAYLVNTICWLVLAPLLAAHNDLLSPVALLIGPPVTILASLALVSGFLFLLLAAVGGSVATFFAWLTAFSLGACDWLVTVADQAAFLRWYVGHVQWWWIVVFYLALLSVLSLGHLQVRWRWLAPAGAAWLCLGLLAGSVRPAQDEFRCTFLSVGHGGCTVMETADGRTLVYDAGALAGPDVTRRHIAPYLRHRGIRRIDELFLSHADLDHFNGVPALLERFAVGQVTWTPTFEARSSPGAQVIVEEVRHKRNIPVRAVSKGDKLLAGSLTIDVLHPPPYGPEGNENARSLVLLVRSGPHNFLLTGDLEGPGLAQVLALPRLTVDVLMAPHHGSRSANTPDLADWARPRVVVSSQKRRDDVALLSRPYEEIGAMFLDTARHGAVTLRSTAKGLGVEWFRANRIRTAAAPFP